MKQLIVCAASAIALLYSEPALSETLSPYRLECSARDTVPTRWVYQSAVSPLIVKGSILASTFATDRSFGSVMIEGGRMTAWVRLEGKPGQSAPTVHIVVIMDGITLADLDAGPLATNKPLAFAFERNAKGLRFTLDGQSHILPGTVPETITVKVSCQAGVYRFDNIELGARAQLPAAMPSQK